MCGIVGYVGLSDPLPILIKGLGRLEYRGYDSAGVAYLCDGALNVVKRPGRLSALVEALRAGQGDPPGGSGLPVGDEVRTADEDGRRTGAGIGHTRWATHGRPSEENAHPHTSGGGAIAVVHNGIIENYLALKEQLAQAGHVFLSETDTEVIPHLIEDAYQGDLAEAVRAAMGRLQGAYALAVMSSDEPGTIVAARRDSPLVVGLGDGENFVASDIPAILDYTRRALILDNGEIAVLTAEGVSIMGSDGSPVQRAVTEVEWDAEAAEKGGYEDFMLKEIHEQPAAVRETLRGRIQADGTVVLEDLSLTEAKIAALTEIFIIACGTSYHAGLVAKHAIEDWSGIPVEVDISSEFRYRGAVVGPNTLVVAITQSGETADTLAGVAEAKRCGACVVGITNVVGSSITRESDCGVIYTRAGPEIGVAATKTLVAQITALYLLALYLGRRRDCLQPEEAGELAAQIGGLPDKVEQALAGDAVARRCADSYKDREDFLFLGRGIGLPVALEGALKLKEISYIHAEGCAAGEMKHGPIALVDAGFPVVAVALKGMLRDKMVSNMEEVRARGARVIAVATEGDSQVGRHADNVFYVPDSPEILSPIIAVIPLQLLAYHTAKARGCDVDKPRNLAKSVTVE